MSMASKYILPCFRLKAGRARKAAKDSEALAFRDELVEALDKAKGKLEATWKALDSIVSKPEYQRLNQQLFDILYTGGLLTSEGKVPTRGDRMLRSSYCVFGSHDELNALRVYEQLIKRLRRRHKYLETAFESHAQRLLTLLGGFELRDRRRLALLLTLFLIDGQLSPRLLLALGHNQATIDEGLALEFMLLICETLKRERGVNFMLQILRQSGLDAKILSFMPPMLRSDLYFRQVYQEHDLGEVIKLHEAHAGQQLRHELQQQLLDDFSEKLPLVDVVMNVRQFQRKHHMSDAEIIAIVWQSITSSNTPIPSGKPFGNTASGSGSGPGSGPASGSGASSGSTVPLGLSSSVDRTLRKVQAYAPLLNGICSTESAQISLLLRMQEWCYEHQALFKHFERLAVQLYRAGVLSEDAIIRWYEMDHIDEGKVAFLEQMHRFVHWLHSNEDANSRVDYDTYVASRQTIQHRSPTVYSDVVPVRLGRSAKFTAKPKTHLN
ncbi:hypothetical protein KR222_004635 [Zaprionus bogoriensis]|nr:hypothetical protein KR222_004635 [Zaprionus bogoriensis]